MFNVGIIGYGLSAQIFHEPFIRAHRAFTLGAIVSSKAADALPENVRHFTSLEAMLREPDIDIVVNAAPTPLHFDLSKQVIEAKKPIILEKPITTTAKEAKQLIQLAEEKNLLFAPYHNRRFTGDFQTVKQLLDSGALGEAHRAEIHFDRFRPTVSKRWRESGDKGSGTLYDLGPHLIDQALQLFGSPDAITARSIALRPQSPSIDYFHLQMHYPHLEVILQCSPYHNAPNPMYCLEGELGTFVKYGLDPQEAQLHSGLSPLDKQFGCEPETRYGKLYLADGTVTTIPTLPCSYLHFYDNLAQTLQGEASLAVTANEALAVIKMIELAQKSSNLGKTLPC